MVSYLRVKKLLVLPVIAFCWSHKVGEWKHECVLPIKIKTHQWLAQSLFVLGQSKKRIRKLILLRRPSPPNPVILGGLAIN